MLLLQGEKAKLSDLRFSHDGKLLAVPVWKKGVQVWRAPFGSGAFTMVPDKAGATQADFTSSGQVLIQGNHTHFLLHDLGTDVTTPVEADLRSGYVYHGGVSPDGRYLVAAQKSWEGGWGWFFCRDLSAPGEDIWNLESKRAAIGTPLFLRDGLVVTFEFDGTGTACVLRNLKTGQIRSERRRGLVRQPGRPVGSADGSLWAVREERVVSVYSASEFGETAASLSSSAKAQFTGHAFHPSGRYLLLSSIDQSVKVYDTATWQVARTYDCDKGKLFSVAVSPDGTLVAAGGDKGQIVVWDWE